MFENKSSNEIKKALSEVYKFRIETHAHTSPVSLCSQVPPRELIETYAKLGYHAVAVTNHFTAYSFAAKSKEDGLSHYLNDYYEAKTWGEQYGIKVYLGLEVRFEKECINDYLLYGVDGDVASKVYDYLDTDLETFRRELKLENSVLIQAHPYRDNITRADPTLIDGVETFNMHPSHNGKIGLAVKFASENGIKTTIAGSDFHHPNQNHEGVGGIRAKYLPKDSFELAQLLKSGDYLLEVGGSSIILP